MIEVLRSADLITKDIRRILDEKLNKRNSAADPSTVVFTQAQAETVITDLITNVVLTQV